MTILSLFTSSVLCHLEQFGVDGLAGLAQDRDQVVGLFHVVGRKEGVGRARFLTAGRAADTVDIVLGGVRVVIIDDKFHILHICKALQCGKKGNVATIFFFCTPQQPHQKKHKLAKTAKKSVNYWILNWAGKKTRKVLRHKSYNKKNKINNLKINIYIYNKQLSQWEHYHGKRKRMHTPFALIPKLKRKKKKNKQTEN